MNLLLRVGPVLGSFPIQKVLNSLSTHSYRPRCDRAGQPVLLLQLRRPSPNLRAHTLVRLPRSSAMDQRANVSGSMDRSVLWCSGVCRLSARGCRLSDGCRRLSACLGAPSQSQLAWGLKRAAAAAAQRPRLELVLILFNSSNTIRITHRPSIDVRVCAASWPHRAAAAAHTGSITREKGRFAEPKGGGGGALPKGEACTRQMV